MIEQIPNEIIEARSHIESERFDAASRILEEFVTEENSEFDETFAYSLLSVSQQGQGRIEDAIASAEMAGRLFRKVEDPNGQADVLLRLGMLEASIGNDQRAADWFSEAAEISRVQQNGPVLLAALVSLAVLEYEQRKFEVAKAHFDEAFSVNRYVRNLEASRLIRTHLRLIRTMQSLHQTVEEQFGSAISDRALRGDMEGEAKAVFALARMRLLIGELGGALTLLEQFSQGPNGKISLSRLQSDDLRKARHLFDSKNYQSCEDAILRVTGSVSSGADLQLPRPASVDLVIFRMSRIDLSALEQLEELSSIATKARDEADKQTEIDAILEWSYLLGETGDPRSAAEVLEPALELSLGVEDSTSHVKALKLSADLYFRLGSWTSAEEAYRKLLDYSKRVGHDIGVASALLGMADVMRSTNRTKEARQSIRDALRYAQEHSLSDKEANALHNLAFLDSQQGNYAEAIKKLTAVLKIRTGSGDASGKAISLTLLGQEEARRKNFARAKELFDQALQIWIDEANDAQAAEAWRNLATTSQEMKDYVSAKIEIYECIEINQAIGNIKDEAVGFVQLGTILRDQNQRDKALVSIAIGIYLDVMSGSDFLAIHRRFAFELATRWNMLNEWESTLRSAEVLYGTDSGRGVLTELARPL